MKNNFLPFHFSRSNRPYRWLRSDDLQSSQAIPLDAHHLSRVQPWWKSHHKVSRGNQCPQAGKHHRRNLDMSRIWCDGVSQMSILVEKRSKFSIEFQRNTMSIDVAEFPEILLVRVDRECERHHHEAPTRSPFRRSEAPIRPERARDCSSRDAHWARRRVHAQNSQLLINSRDVPMELVHQLSAEHREADHIHKLIGRSIGAWCSATSNS